MMKRSDYVHIERALQLPIGSISDPEFLKLPETVALLKVIETFPWLIEVADYGYKSDIAKLILQREAINLKLEEAKK